MAPLAGARCCQNTLLQESDDEKTANIFITPAPKTLRHLIAAFCRGMGKISPNDEFLAPVRQMPKLGA